MLYQHKFYESEENRKTLQNKNQELEDELENLKDPKKKKRMFLNKPENLKKDILLKEKKTEEKIIENEEEIPNESGILQKAFMNMCTRFKNITCNKEEENKLEIINNF